MTPGGKAWVNPQAAVPGDTLRKYCIDLTQQARDGKLDPVIGRDEEMRRTIEILSRRTKNNPVLIGEPGVGKTAVRSTSQLTRNLIALNTACRSWKG